MSPFTITVNRPSVSKIAGSDRIITIGRRMVFIIENISPANKNAQTFVARSTSLYPVPNILTATQRPKEFRIHLRTNTKNCFFILYLHYIGIS
jgi:hypothetical protein